MRINRWMDVEPGHFRILPEWGFILGWPHPHGELYWRIYFGLGWGQWFFNFEVLF